MRNKKIKVQRCASRKSYGKRSGRRGKGLLSSLTNGLRRVASHVKKEINQVPKIVNRLRQSRTKSKPEVYEMQDFPNRVPGTPRIDWIRPDTFDAKEFFNKQTKVQPKTRTIKWDEDASIYSGSGKKIRI